ncbi:hypothetical protein [Marilutibacter chinensis]|uniref:Uncharacterized protein n=1 Tax=Marilutibacter chinensis TaxID=2912247 RepID=A0ABS9HQ65_9GAMM|nr:hypothetical protein [Lysobacter chinensis]MCF7221080.1 hypothetical protein [Lysobacter chinensis]
MRLLLTNVLLAFALCLSAPASAHDDDEWVFYQASELVPWCRQEAEALYIGLGMTPYQWAASYHDRSNVLYVQGRLRVHGDDVAVRCRVARGARERYAVIEVDDPTLQQESEAAGGIDGSPLRAAQATQAPR